MRHTDDPRIAELIAAENAYTAHRTAHDQPLRDLVFSEIKARVRETDLSVPVRRGDWWYVTRTVEGSAYPMHLRSPAHDDVPPDDTSDATVILDENVVAEGHEHSQIGGAAVSPDGALLAWSVDHTGDESYTLMIRDLDTLTDRAETVPGVSYPLAWSHDATYVFYTTLDHIQRPAKVWRHRIGTSADSDVVVFSEPDERFYVGVENSRDDGWILITANSAVTGETWILDGRRPTDEPWCVAPRVDGVEYAVEAHRDDLYVLTNARGAEDFALFRADARDPKAPWREVIGHTPGVRLEGVDAFDDHLVVQLRSGGVTGLRILDADGTKRRDVELPETVGTVAPGANPEPGASGYRHVYESLVTPPTVFSEDITTGERTVLKTTEVLGGYDPDELVTERIWVRAADGTDIPVTTVRRRDTPLDGTAPCMLYGYGAYEISVDPWFSAARLSLVERGWVYAIAHVRGGGELGRHWYTDGKFAAKPNSFTDFVACARHLVDSGFTTPERLVARGGSAGGLLVGAAVNLAPELFAAVIAEVPFVDPLNTLLDASLPLTVTEWDEWGDPVHDPEAAQVIASYSPYENVRGVPYPAMLITTGVHDPRVSVHEPLKWAQRLRDVTTGDRPILVRIDTGGHGGPTGRYDAWRDEAFVLAFALGAVAQHPPQR